MKKCICWDLLSNTVLYLHMSILQPDIVIRKQMKITSFTTMFSNTKVHISPCRSVLWIHSINSLSLILSHKFKNTNHSFLFKNSIYIVNLIGWNLWNPWNEPMIWQNTEDEFDLFQVMLLLSSKWRWYLCCSRRHGRKWSMTCSRLCVWPLCPLCSAWWDFISTKRLMPRSQAKRRQRTRRARRNNDTSTQLFK